MPRVHMHTSAASRTQSWDEGEEYDVSPEEAQDLVGSGAATLVTTERVENPEMRRAPLERRGPGRPRNSTR